MLGYPYRLTIWSRMIAENVGVAKAQIAIPMLGKGLDTSAFDELSSKLSSSS